MISTKTANILAVVDQSSSSTLWRTIDHLLA